jgi:hypothetical protein
MSPGGSVLGVVPIDLDERDVSPTRKGWCVTAVLGLRVPVAF